MPKKDKIIITSGEFDPLHYEELVYLQRCRKKGNWLIVGLHSDWYMDARGGIMQSFFERYHIIKNLSCVDAVFRFNDRDGTVCQLLKLVKICYPDADIVYVSPQDMHNQPETKIKGITFETMK